MELTFSKHALDQITYRDISKEMVLSVVNYPDLIIQQDEGIRIYSKLVEEGSKIYLYRVFVNYVKNPVVIITAYRTSKIKKYGY